jgi:hypothetical protein
VTTPSVPPTPSLITAGNSDSTTAPTSQNQDTITMPSHSRGSPYNIFSSRTVEVQGLRVIGRSGAEGTVAGMRDANAQHSTERPTTASEIHPTCVDPETNRPPAMVPIRIAMNVAPSTSALPIANSPVDN